MHRSAAEIVRLGIARTFQGTRLFPALSVAENVRAAAQLRHRTSMLDALLGTPRRVRAERDVEAMTGELLDLVRLGRAPQRPRPRPRPTATSGGSSSSGRWRRGRTC